MEQGITVFDQDFRLTCWNRQYRALLDLPDEMGQVGVSLDQILRHLAAARRHRAGRAADHARPPDRASAARGSSSSKTSGRILELRSNPMPDGGIVATYADITARVEADLALKRANESLEQRVRERTAELTRVNEELAQAQMLAEEANLGKTRFLAAAGHDILQPLNAARLYCSSLIEKAGKGATGEAAAQHRILAGIGRDHPRRRARHLAARRRRHEAGRDACSASTGCCARSAPTSSRWRARRSSNWSSCRRRSRCDTDRNLLRRLVQNLVSNAIKYTRNGRILVGVRRRGELAEIQVIDTGIGIPADKLEHRLPANSPGSTKARAKRRGWASACRSSTASRACCGSNSSIDSGRGKGTRFSVILPVTAAQSTAARAAATPGRAAGAALDGLTVLCIDNDARILDGMRLLLEGWGCAVSHPSGLADLRRAAGAMPARHHPRRLPSRRRKRARRDREAARGFGERLPAVLVTADRSNEVRAAADADRRAGDQQAAEAGRAALDDDAACGAWRRRRGIVAASAAGSRRPKRVACRSCDSRMTAWVRLSTPSFCRTAETCALMVASDTPSS